MLKDLFDALTQHAEKAMTPVVIHPEGEPDHNYLVAMPDGGMEWFEADPAPRLHNAFDLATVARWASQGAKPSPWCSRRGVVLVLDDDTRRDVVRLDLVESPQLATLRALEERKPAFDQKAFARLLRIDLAGCLASPNLLQSVKQVKFSVLKGLEGEASHGKESIGKTLQAELKGANAVPEEAEVVLPVWSGQAHPTRYCVRCAVEIDVIGERFQLIPFPGAIEDAFCRAEAALLARLAEELAQNDCDIPVHYGTP